MESTDRGTFQMHAATGPSKAGIQRPAPSDSNFAGQVDACSTKISWLWQRMPRAFLQALDCPCLRESPLSDVFLELPVKELWFLPNWEVSGLHRGISCFHKLQQKSSLPKFTLGSIINFPNSYGRQWKSNRQRL